MSFPTPFPASWEQDPADAEGAAAFLLDRLNEEQRAAGSAPNPSRVLADVAAKRGIVKRYRLMMNAEPGEHRSAESIGVEQLVLAEMIRRLAAVYTDHPHYRNEWSRT